MLFESSAARRAFGMARVGMFFLAALIWAGGAPDGSAHEVRPAVADATVSADEITLDIRLTIEALVAGIDLGSVADTNESPEAADYDALRAEDPATLEAAFRDAWPRISQGFLVGTEGAEIALEIREVRVAPVGDVELVRDSSIRLAGALPPGDAPVTVGWIAAYGPLVVRQAGAGEEAYSGYLTEGALSDPLPRVGVARVGALENFGRYVVIGFEHIIPKGLDHILFVLGLFFFSLKLRPLLLQISAFTVAHTVTLAMATLGVVSVPAEIVEPLIAASIVWIAVENVFFKDMSRWRPLVVFCFGLLHGLGFASVLGEIGLEPGAFIASLIAFNVGVELGQLAVIAAAWLAVGFWFRSKDWYRSGIATPASLAIAAVGAFWVVERTLL